jgi:hypothetical protein
VEEIRTVSEKNNLREEITGVLVETGGLFFQVIEGPADAVDRLYKRISEDSRHKEILLLKTMHNVDGRLFPNWAMKTVHLKKVDPRAEGVRLLLETAVESHRRVQSLSEGIERIIWGDIQNRS